MLNNLHKFFQGKRKSLESFYLLYGMFNRVLLEFYCTVVCLIMSGLIYYMTFFFRSGGGPPGGGGPPLLTERFQQAKDEVPAPAGAFHRAHGPRFHNAVG